MKVQFRNLIYRQAIAKCFMCRKSRIDSRIGEPNLRLLRCVDVCKKCDFSNLYNDKIFNL